MSANILSFWSFVFHSLSSNLCCFWLACSISWGNHCVVNCSATLVSCKSKSLYFRFFSSGQLENLDTGDVFVHEMHSTWNNDKVKQLEVELEETKHLLSKSKTLIADMVMYNLDDRPESYNDVMKQAQELLTELKDY